MLSRNKYSPPEDLISAHKNVAGVEAVINANSLGYVSLEGLMDAAGISKELTYFFNHKACHCCLLLL